MYYYSYSTSAPGSVITLAQTQTVAQLVLTEIPVNKLQIVFSLYGWDWPLVSHGAGKLVDFQTAMATAQTYGVTPVRDPTQQTSPAVGSKPYKRQRGPRAGI